MNEYKAFEAVKKFHQKNGAVIAEQPSGLPVSTALLRQRLMLEELGELACACHDGDLEKIADGLCDLLYVVLGTCVSLGIPVKADLIDANAVAKLAPTIITCRYLTDLSKAISKCLEEALMTDQDKHHRITRLTLERAISEINGFAFIYQINLEECFFEVHRANMSKNLGGAIDGRKYGDNDAKGEGYRPPNLKPILGIVEA